MATYDAFISYSHAKDKPVAAALQSVIQKLGKAWHQRRALRVFRDDTSLSATPHLWPSIEQALGASRFLILLASPEAAASKWVGREVECWLAHKGVNTLLIALTAGALAWHETGGDFRWTEATPLPPILKDVFQTEPKWIDLTAYRSSGNPRDSRFLELGANFAAAIRGIPKEDLLSQAVRQQRRALTLAWSAAATLLILVGCAAWQWTEAVAQQTQAQAQRARAESTLEAGTASANNFTLNIAARMRRTIGVPTDLVRDILKSAQEFQDELVKHNDNNPKLRRSRALLLRETSQTLLLQGDMEDALAYALRAREVMDSLPARVRDDPEVQHELSHTYNRIGEALSLVGRSEEALDAFRTALTIREELAAKHPHTEQELALALSHERVGDELRRLREDSEALRSYRTSFDIRQQAVQSDPENHEALGVLAVSYDRIGLTLGDTNEAFEAYSMSSAIRERLVKTEPRNARWHRDLAASYDNVGSYQLQQGHRDEAMALFRKARAIRATLAAGDPKNPQWQALLVISYVKIAEAGEEPVDNYAHALTIVIALERTERLTVAQRPWRSEIERRLHALQQ
jgi:tetratricopeptide (TPR) repeat protein